MTKFKKQYRDLEMRVLNELREIVEQSEYKSKHYSSKAISINVKSFEEIVIADSLRLVDAVGVTYHILNLLDLEELIDIVNQHRPEL